MILKEPKSYDASNYRVCATVLGAVTETVDRKNLWQVQTPQVFQVSLYAAALAKAKAAGLYNTWYETCEIYSEIKTADQLGYDDEGNKITE